MSFTTPWVPMLKGNILPPHPGLARLNASNAVPQFNLLADFLWCEFHIEREEAFKDRRQDRMAAIECIHHLWRLRETRPINVEDPTAAVWAVHLMAWEVRRRRRRWPMRFLKLFL
jgi:hypothetical protein